MKGQTVGGFIDDILSMGGPEKEFVFRNKFYFLEALCNDATKLVDLYVDEFDNSDPKNKELLCTHTFSGKDFAECVALFEKAPIFEGLTIYQAEGEIEVLYG